MLRLLIVFTLITASSYAATEPLFKASYKGAYGSLNIKMTRTLVAQDNGYELRSYAKAFMSSIDEVSKFQKEGEVLVPQRYRYARKIFGVKKREELTFDWKTLSTTYYENGDKEGEVALISGMLDPTLYQLQMQIDLANKNTSGTYTFARREQKKTYKFASEGKESIKVSDKNYEALRYARVDDDKATRFWLIPTLDFVVAKIEHTEEDGDTYEVSLVDYERSNELDAFLITKQR